VVDGADFVDPVINRLASLGDTGKLETDVVLPVKVSRRERRNQ
jgi:hypothetical protein